MNGNYSLVELAEEVQRIEEAKQDYLYPAKSLTMIDDEYLSLPKTDGLKITDNAHQQIAQKLDIPKKYYDKMASVPGLRTHNVNTWFRESESKNLVRTVDGKARAFLSDRFKPIDNFLVLNGFLPVVKDMEMTIKSCTLTENKMYLQVIFPQIHDEIEVGDVVALGAILQNSEVGRGAFDVRTFIERLKCKNGMVGQSVLRQYHAGRRIGDEIEDYDIFKDDTIQAELVSFQKRMRDILSSVVSDLYFQNAVNKMRIANGQQIEDIPETIGNVTRKYNLSQDEEKNVLKNIIADGNTTRWGLANGITALAHEIEDAERQYEVEKIGYDIIELSKSEWEQIAV